MSSLGEASGISSRSAADYPHIHPTAIIDPRAEIDPTVQIGPCAFIEAGVRIAAGCKIGPYVHIQGLTTIGEGNEIGTGSTIGLPPQHVEYKGAPTQLIIGNHNRIREYASIHRAFHEGDATTIGDRCFIMGFSHIAHDCHIGNGVILANGALLAGHITVGDRSFISGNTGIHQFCRVGRLAMVGGGSRIPQDVPPFMIVEGSPAYIRAINVVGLRRAGFSTALRTELKGLYRLLYRSGKTAKHAIEGIDKGSLSPEALELVNFYETPTKRGVVPFGRYRRSGESPEDAE